MGHTEKVAGVNRVREEICSLWLLTSLWGSCFAPKVSMGARDHHIHAYDGLTGTHLVGREQCPGLQLLLQLLSPMAGMCAVP